MLFTSAKPTLHKERDFAVPFAAMSTNVRSISLILTLPNSIRSAGSWEKKCPWTNKHGKFDKGAKETCCSASRVPLSGMILQLVSVSIIVCGIWLIFSDDAENLDCCLEQLSLCSMHINLFWVVGVFVFVWGLGFFFEGLCFGLIFF